MAGRTTKKRRRAARRRRGPTKYTADSVVKICAAIATGDTIEEACKRVGIHRDTFYEWQRTHSDVSDKVQAAKDARLLVLEERWAKATLKDWRAAEAMLRVLKPKQFAHRINVLVESELTAAMARLKEAFGDNVQGLELALSALAGESRAAGAEDAPAGKRGSDAGGGEAVHSTPAVGAAAGVPGS